MDKTTTGDASLYEKLGGFDNIQALADCFYDIMSTLPEAQKIRHMHPQDLGPTSEHLSLFLSGWLGGPHLYLEKFGSINLTELHAPFDIDIAERDMWLECMKIALEQQHIDDSLQKELLNRFRVPADKIRLFCQQRKQTLPLAFPGS